LLPAFFVLGSDIFALSRPLIAIGEEITALDKNQLMRADVALVVCSFLWAPRL
jgi:hypothetical protein